MLLKPYVIEIKISTSIIIFKYLLNIEYVYAITTPSK